jgi:hypothetical protein
MPISLIFCEEDVALEYLTDRLGLRLAAVQETGYVRLLQVPDIDHSMHRVWLRSKVLELFVEELSHWAGAVDEPRGPQPSRT